MPSFENVISMIFKAKYEGRSDLDALAKDITGISDDGHEVSRELIEDISTAFDTIAESAGEMSSAVSESFDSFSSVGDASSSIDILSRL